MQRVCQFGFLFNLKKKHQNNKTLIINILFFRIQRLKYLLKKKKLKTETFSKTEEKLHI
jgi:hypothetical protein